MNAPESFYQKGRRTKTCSWKPGRSVIDRQVILTGTPDDIKKIVDKVREKLYSDNIYEPEINILDPWDEIVLGDDLVIRLYDTGPDETEEAIWYVIEEIYKQASADNCIVFADPNFVIIDEQSGGVNGGPGGNVGREAALEAYKNHWVFKEKKYGSWGINLGEKEEDKFPFGRLEDRGAGVEVFIFDSFDDKIYQDPHRSGSSQAIEIQRDAYEADQICYDSNSALIRLTQQPHLKLDHQEFIRVVENDYQGAKDPHEIPEHGIFVAGLIHRVAPEAAIDLIDVLDDRGRCDLYSLLKALNYFVSPNSVVNLSLGVNFSEDLINKNGVRTAIEALYNQVKDQKIVNRILLEQIEEMIGRDLYIAPLRMVIQELVNKRNAVIIAAAGNNNKPGLKRMRLPSLFPARYPEVIGVGASGKGGYITCYSNEGEVLAPGGSTGPNCDLNDWEGLCSEQGSGGLIDCDDNSKKNKKPCDCRSYALISIVPVDKKHLSGLGYWRGTSFSTALVSGLATLVIEKYRKVNSDKTADPAEIRKFIVDNSVVNNEGGRVIDVGKTLDAIKPPLMAA